MMNLPNPDILGHTENFAATVKAIHCVDLELERLAAQADASGFDLFVTSDHGNAEAMSPKDGPYVGHTTNPVPLIVASRRGFRLRRDDPRPCIGAVAWTVLDALGLEVGNPRSLLLR